MPRAPAEMVPRQICRDGEQPGGKSLSHAEGAVRFENADKSFLCEIVGVVLVAGHAAEKMKERRGVTLHPAVERGIVAGLQPFHVGPVKGVGRRLGVSADAHGRRRPTWTVPSV